MRLENILNVLLVAIALTACASPYPPVIGVDGVPINLIPMYGYPTIEKTDAQKKADEDFIRSVGSSPELREKSSKYFAGQGWAELQNGNTDNAMRKFNQSWLLDPKYYLPLWGFGAVALINGDPVEAVTHFEKALYLIDVDDEKPRLLVDSARAYAQQANKLNQTDNRNSERLFNKANALIGVALNADPQFGHAYFIGALIYYDQADYQKAWNLVNKSHAIDSYDIDPDFIVALSGKLKEQVVQSRDCAAQDGSTNSNDNRDGVIEDFESRLSFATDINGMLIGYFSFRDSNNTRVNISTTAAYPPLPGETDGNNVLQLDLDVRAWGGLVHNFENAAVDTWTSLDWSAFDGFSFWLYGDNSGTSLFVDVLDNRSPCSTTGGAEIYTYAFADDFSGWKHIHVPFADLTRKEIGNGAPNDGLGLTEIHGWAFGTLNTSGNITFYIDNFELRNTP